MTFLEIEISINCENFSQVKCLNKYKIINNFVENKINRIIEKIIEDFLKIE